jgi:hypothetical protein
MNLGLRQPYPTDPPFKTTTQFDGAAQHPEWMGTKFIISDDPVTFFNRKIYPGERPIQAATISRRSARAQSCHSVLISA